MLKRNIGTNFALGGTKKVQCLKDDKRENKLTI